MEKEKQLTNEQSLAIIQQMISQAKSNFTDNGISWLLWGTMIFLASLSTYFFIETQAQNIFLGWNIFGAITIVLLSYELLRPKKITVRTYVDDLMKLVDAGFIICMCIVIISINLSVGPNNGFGFMLMVFAFLMLIKGGAVKSRSLMIGAIVNWLGAIAIFINREFKYDMLIMAGAVLVGYIIPGMLLLISYKKQKTESKQVK